VRAARGCVPRANAPRARLRGVRRSRARRLGVGRHAARVHRRCPARASSTHKRDPRPETRGQRVSARGERFCVGERYRCAARPGIRGSARIRRRCPSRASSTHKRDPRSETRARRVSAREERLCVGERYRWAARSGIQAAPGVGLTNAHKRDPRSETRGQRVFARGERLCVAAAPRRSTSWHPVAG